ncbi:MAG: ABC transporter ATP-binding protein [Acidobacteria bacterium]|nr:ABC transporter ATP-binding protein [Acidobacteriota bacterium]
MDAIVCEQLTKFYGTRVGIENVSFSVGEGQICGFLGPNGAGKSTTLRLLAGLMKPTTGTSRVLGMNAWNQRESIMSDVGYLPGEVRVWNWMTANDALSFLNRVHACELASSWRRMTDLFELNPDVRVRNMSKGMRQKLGLIMALVHNPRVLIFDEPTSGLDPVMQERLLSELRTRASNGSAILFSSHSLKEVEHLCDRVVMVRRGALIEDTSIKSLSEQAVRQVRIQFPREPVTSFENALWAQKGLEWKGTIQGDSKHVAAWALSQDASDLVIESPDLEHLFQSRYRDEP